MKKLSIILLTTFLLGACGNKTFEDVKEEASKKWTTNGEIEVFEEALKNKSLEGEELKKAEVYLAELVEARAKNIKRGEINKILPPRDGFNSGVAFSVIDYLKENTVNYENIKFIQGGNTLRLSNGLFFQDVRMSFLGNEETMYFLIKDNGYDSSSISGVLKDSTEFYDNYLKAYGIEILADEVYDYYFED